ncbi:MAG: flagellar basal body P-ring formation chaperone FlgA [Ignavibacteriaceae bacterium]
MYTFFLIILSFIGQGKNSFSEDLNNYLKKNLIGRFEDYKYEVLQMPKSYDKIELLKTDDFNLSGNMIYIPVKIFQKNSRVIESIISVKLKIFKSVLVASKDIMTRQPLTEKDFCLKKIDVAQLNGVPVSSFKEINSLRSKEFIKAGEVLTSEMVESLPIIKAGDPVTAKYIDGNVLITFNALSRQDGALGDTITIIAKDKKLYKAKIIDAKNVIIIE